MPKGETCSSWSEKNTEKAIAYASTNFFQDEEKVPATEQWLW